MKKRQNIFFFDAVFSFCCHFISKTKTLSVTQRRNMKNESLTLRHRIGLEIARKLNNDLQKEHPLKQLFWECTLRCNLHCRHCGSDCKKICGHAERRLPESTRQRGGTYRPA